MRFAIGSDIHGSEKFCSMFLERTRDCDRILLLGDLYYNGARNDPPEGYAPKKVVALLNAEKDRLLVVKGNCESEVDQMVSLFPINDMVTLFAFGRTITMSHGHRYSFDNLPAGCGDVFVQGHTHVSVLRKEGGRLLLNPGSISLPKDGRHSYMVLDEKGVVLYDLLTGEKVSALPF